MFQIKKSWLIIMILFYLLFFANIIVYTTTIINMNTRDKNENVGEKKVSNENKKLMQTILDNELRYKKVQDENKQFSQSLLDNNDLRYKLECEIQQLSLIIHRDVNSREVLKKEIKTLKKTMMYNDELTVTNKKIREDLESDTTNLRNIITSIYPHNADKATKIIMVRLFQM